VCAELAFAPLRWRGQEAIRSTIAVHLFSIINVSSDPADLSAAAAIRIAAMGLFAERGYADVTVRQIAAAAGVSPALVIHHYGSKEKLRDILDERVAAFIEALLADLERVPAEGGSASLAQLFADRLEREPVLAGYVRRLLGDGSPAGIALFRRLYRATQAGLRALEHAGVVRPGQDQAVRDAFLLCNDLAVVLLRPHIMQATGIDPLSREGLVRWSAEVFDVYASGIFVLPASADDDMPADGEGDAQR
jgi:AcrR family transcriptional regulator